MSSANENKAFLVKVMHSLSKKTQTKLSSTPVEVPQTEIYVAHKHNGPRILENQTTENSSDERTDLEHPKLPVKKVWSHVQDLSSSDDTSDSDLEQRSFITEDISTPRSSQDSMTYDT